MAREGTDARSGRGYTGDIMAIRKSRQPKKAHPGRRVKRKPTLWEKLGDLGKSIPPEELERFPRDGARNLHHYLHGAAKQD